MGRVSLDTELHKRYWISKFSKVEIPLPPLETQKHIAQILDDAAALRDKTAQLIAAYDALAQSIFLDMFGDPVKNEKGWEKVNIKENAEKFCDGPFGSNLKTEHYQDNGIPVLLFLFWKEPPRNLLLLHLLSSQIPHL